LNGLQLTTLEASGARRSASAAWPLVERRHPSISLLHVNTSFVLNQKYRHSRLQCGIRAYPLVEKALDDE